jgi:hypothetical protein
MSADSNGSLQGARSQPPSRFSRLIAQRLHQEWLTLGTRWLMAGVSCGLLASIHPGRGHTRVVRGHDNEV